MRRIVGIDGEVRSLARPTHPHRHLNADILLGIAILFDEASRPSLAHVLFGCVLAQLARDEAADFPRWNEIGDVVGQEPAQASMKRSTAFADKLTAFDLSATDFFMVASIDRARSHPSSVVGIGTLTLAA